MPYSYIEATLYSVLIVLSYMLIGLVVEALDNLVVALKNLIVI